MIPTSMSVGKDNRMSINKRELDKENKQKLQDGIIVSQKELIGYAIYEAITCRQYIKVPVSIDYMIRDMNAICESEFEKVTEDFYCKTFKNVNEIERWIKEHLMVLDSFKQLNISEYEFNKKITCESDIRLRCADNRLNDFTDLGAYARNLAHDLLREYLDIDYRSFWEKN